MVTNWLPFLLVTVSTGSRFYWFPFLLVHVSRGYFVDCCTRHRQYDSDLVVNHNNKKAFQSKINFPLSDSPCFFVDKFECAWGGGGGSCTM